MFCAPGIIFGYAEGAGFDCHILRSRNHLGRYRQRQVPFSCFALPNSFLAILRAPGPVFMFYSLGLILVDTVGAESRFQVLRFHTRLGLYRGRQIPFSSFALQNSFLTITRASGHIFMYCAPKLFFSGTECVRSYFNVCTSELILGVLRAPGPVFMFCAPELIFHGTEGVGTRFHVLHCWTRFRRYRGRRV
jgi:hypothetical protein